MEAAARDVQAKGRLQPWSSKGWRPGLVEAAAKELEGFRAFWRVLGVWSLANGRLEGPNKRGLCAGNAGGVLGVLGVLGVWSLANGRLEGPNKRGLCAGKGQAAMLERWRPRAWWKLPRGMCRQSFEVLRVCKPGSTAGSKALTRESYVQAKEGFRRFRGFRGLKPGKRQARRP